MLDPEPSPDGRAVLLCPTFPEITVHLHTHTCAPVPKVIDDTTVIVAMLGDYKKA